MTHVKRITVERPLLKIGCTLGEGPLYDPATDTLHFVDILEKRVYHLNVKNLELAFEQFQEPITCLALRTNGKGLACAAARGFGILEGDGELKYVSTPLSEDRQMHVRFNDGACDSQGRFLAGTLESKEQGIPGELYRYDPRDGSCIVVDKGPFTDSNGMGWSPDEKTFYFTDSLRNLIYAYDYEDGNISNRRIFIDAIAQGLPKDSYCDGFCIDSEGCIWSARWGSSNVIRFDRDGKIDVEIFFPTALKITACCFGGLNADQLYVTSAHCGAVSGDPALQEKYYDSGDLFAVDLSGSYKGATWRYKFAG